MFSLKNSARKGLKLRKGMGYLALTGELWGVIFVDFGENWPCYNDTIPYYILIYGKKVWIHLDSSTHWPPVDFNESLEKHNKISNISRIKFQNFLAPSCSCLCPIYWCKVFVRNEDVVGAVPTGDARSTSEWSTILLPTKVTYIRGLRVILKQILVIDDRCIS